MSGEPLRISDLRFLIAEDHEFQLSMLVRMLESLGATDIKRATDGSAALEIIENRPVDIVISDLDMPGMDGMEFIRHLGEAKAPVSIILASSLERSLLTSVETMTAAYGINLLGVIEKPPTAEKLQKLIALHRLPRTAQDKSGKAADIISLGEILQGLENDEFEPFFQPKVELATGKIKGAEALARWLHPQRGLVAPYAFIKILEDSGNIDALTWIILRKAAAVCRKWIASGFDFTASVNLSLKSLADVQFADRVTDLVRSQGVEPRQMIIEITESAATADVGKALENLSRLRMKGFGLSIDDYGTGYSSMQQLTRIAFTELKIDQAFVKNAAKQESSRIILESSIAMSKKLNITSVAEGVETREDWDLLRRLGCSLAQGYFIAKPMAADAYFGWVRDWVAPV